MLKQVGKVRVDPGHIAQLVVPVGIAVSVAWWLQRKRRRRRTNRGQADRLGKLEGTQEAEVDALSTLAAESAVAARDAQGGAAVPPLEETVLDIVLPVGPQALWHVTMEDPTFALKFHALKRNRDVQIEPWKQTGAVRVRQVRYVTPVKKNMFGPSEAFTQELQGAQRPTDQGFVVDVKAYTPQVPFGSAFHNQLQLVAQQEDGAHTRLCISAQINFTDRRKVGFTAGLIKKASLEGVRETYMLYGQALQRHLAETRLPAHIPTAIPTQPGPAPVPTLGPAGAATAFPPKLGTTSPGLEAWRALGLALCTLLCVAVMMLTWHRLAHQRADGGGGVCEVTPLQLAVEALQGELRAGEGNLGLAVVKV